jgi:hypothetical protein
MKERGGEREVTDEQRYNLQKEKEISGERHGERRTLRG